jgi:hypothetical protein
MQELVNDDDLGRPAILQKPISELSSADANEPRAGLCERQRRPRAALRCLAVIEEPQQREGFDWTPPAHFERRREVLAAVIREVGEEILAAGAGETSGGALDRAPHS